MKGSIFSALPKNPSVPDDIKNLSSALCECFIDTVSALRGLAENHPDVHKTFEPELMHAFFKPARECLSPAKAAVYACGYTAWCLVDEIAAEDPRRALAVLESLDRELGSFMFALPMAVIKCLNHPSKVVQERAKVIVEGLGAEGCVQWLEALRKENFEGLHDRLEDGSQGSAPFIFGE